MSLSVDVKKTILPVIESSPSEETIPPNWGVKRVVREASESLSALSASASAKAQAIGTRIATIGSNSLASLTTLAASLKGVFTQPEQVVRLALVDQAVTSSVKQEENVEESARKESPKSRTSSVVQYAKDHPYRVALIVVGVLASAGALGYVLFAHAAKTAVTSNAAVAIPTTSAVVEKVVGSTTSAVPAFIPKTLQSQSVTNNLGSVSESFQTPKAVAVLSDAPISLPNQTVVPVLNNLSALPLTRISLAQNVVLNGTDAYSSNNLVQQTEGFVLPRSAESALSDTTSISMSDKFINTLGSTINTVCSFFIGANDAKQKGPVLIAAPTVAMDENVTSYELVESTNASVSENMKFKMMVAAGGALGLAVAAGCSSGDESIGIPAERVQYPVAPSRKKPQGQRHHGLKQKRKEAKALRNQG